MFDEEINGYDVWAKAVMPGFEEPIRYAVVNNNSTHYLVLCNNGAFPEKGWQEVASFRYYEDDADATYAHALDYMYRLLGTIGYD